MTDQTPPITDADPPTGNPSDLPGWDAVTLTPDQLAEGEALGLTPGQAKLAVYVTLARKAKEAAWTVEQLVKFTAVRTDKPGVTLADWQAIRGQRDHQGRFVK